MAARNWSAVRELVPEERIAAEVVRRSGVQPPVDLAAVVNAFADLEEVEIPGACDGLVVGLHRRDARPIILVDRLQSDRRQRFTVAHELGHFLIPWHTGSTFLCDTSRIGADFGGAVIDPEPGANRFAAELLVPSEWLAEKISTLGADEIAPLLAALDEGRVSAYVACLRLRSMLPAGHAFVVKRNGAIQMAAQTDGTGVLPYSPDEIDEGQLSQWASSVERVKFGPTTVTWWNYRGTAALPDHGADAREWRDVLQGLLERHVSGEAERRTILQTLNGVIAAEHGEAKRDGVRDAGSLFVRFRARFAKARRIPSALLEDPDFELLLQKRAAEFERR